MGNCCSIKKEVKSQDQIRRVSDVYSDEGLDGYYEETPHYEKRIDEAVLHSRSLRQKLQSLLGITPRE